MAHHPGLQVDEDEAFERQAAQVGRTARVLLAVVLLLALAGAFGGGPLSRTEVGPAGGPALRYDRIGRLDAPLALTVVLPPGDSTVALSRPYADALQVEAVLPQPAQEAASSASRTFTFSTDGARPTPVTIRARPLRFGVLRGSIDAGDARLAVRHFVYP